MKLQYISDSNGITTGVYIPISEWNALKNKYQEIELEETDNIPQWHKDIVLSRIENFKKYPEQVLDFDDAMDEIEKNP